MINADRLLRNLHELRNFGRCGNGVVRRCLTEVDLQSRHWLVDKMSLAGLDANIDGIANVIGISPNPGKALLIGSHSDTQPTGGWLDGALGVIYGVEIAQALHERESTRHLALDVASWADEESHYLGMMGSRSFCGQLDEAEIDAARNPEGHALRDALKAFDLDCRPRLRLDAQRYSGYLEAHIEQGPWLEAEDKRIGVVTSIVGMRDLIVRFQGQQNHAGTTPMHLRRDAAMALFEFATLINRAFTKMAGERTVWTIGQIEITPNARSIVPGSAFADLQFRDPDQRLVDALQQRVFEIVDEFTRQSDIELSVELHDESARAVDMDASIQQALADSAERHAPGRWRQMPSGAAHDAQILAAHLPAGMLFVPSIGGISHDFAEDTDEQDIILGCEVLADAVLQLLT